VVFVPRGDGCGVALGGDGEFAVGVELETGEEVDDEVGVAARAFVDHVGDSADQIGRVGIVGGRNVLPGDGHAIGRSAGVRLPPCGR